MSAAMSRAWRSRRRVVAAAAGILAAGLALALTGPSVGPASAAEANTWGTFSVDGAARAYTGTMTLPGGFPATSFTSTSRQATVVSGASTWQSAGTPVGAVYGSSKGRPYLNQRPNADNPTSPAITTYTFATPTPASGWSFVLGDIDADQATVSATAADGSAVPVSDLGFQGVYNYCHQAGGPSCDAANLNDLPTWFPATGVLRGNTAGDDTEGASGWFSPNVSLKTLTISYQERKGLPVYQTWFATKTFSPSGTVTVDGTPTGGIQLTVRDASGAVVGSPTTADDGTWSLPGLVSTSGYTVSAETPPGATALDPLAFDTLDADTPGLDFAFTAPTVAVTGTIETDTGEPASNETVVFTPDAGDLPATTVTTDDAGAFTADLFPSQRYTAVIGDATDQPIRFTAPAASGSLDAPLVQTPPPVTSTPTPTPTTTPSVTTAADPSVPELAMTGSSPAGPIGLGVLLALGGAGLVVRARLRARR
ncbi:hypothetical protein GCM10025867_40710 [Frondihabitans sucicola]|uniref:Alpha-amylase n=1 Tax=Frondihabitans sucicola TaxID=1268041 RepID=A0ABN6Y749_9MICO|nr:hypothetical protein [Frondihabitans sucicola]BDZ51830.1 hypothetical protein GCM10025867_40710 [Frondihabitans sucicola]